VNPWQDSKLYAEENLTETINTSTLNRKASSFFLFPFKYTSKQLKKKKVLNCCNYAAPLHIIGIPAGKMTDNSPPFSFVNSN